uniref:RRM domain-containing protein n=1 Tax=Acrobeloides nanus TaxID=290746 RepID=A0A914DRU6_9BILA
MVKLFVGNLGDSVDSHRLKNLFLEFDLTVLECDVLKNFAFVHVPTDDDAQKAIDKLNKYKLEGREIHIERSTSRLRKEPGMGDKCFTCGALDHKTPNCPQEQSRRKTLKRSGENEEGPNSKKSTVSLVSNNSFSTISSSVSNPPQCWGYKVGGGAEGDPELPCPTNPELRTLYDQYLESRTRYFYFRERLAKELSHQPSTPQTQPAAQPIRIDLTKPLNPMQSNIPAQIQPQYNIQIPANQQTTPNFAIPASGAVSAAVAPYASAYRNQAPFAGLPAASVPSSMTFSSQSLVQPQHQVFSSQTNAYASTPSINASISSTPSYNPLPYNVVPRSQVPPLGSQPIQMPPTNTNTMGTTSFNPGQMYNATNPNFLPTQNPNMQMTSSHPHVNNNQAFIGGMNMPPNFQQQGILGAPR